MDLSQASNTDIKKNDNTSIIEMDDTPSVNNTDSIENQGATRRFGFSINEDLHFLVAEGLYCELIINVQLASLPYAPPHVAGLLNLRGNIITVYGLNEFINHGKSPTKYAYLIGSPSEGAALLIGEKPNIIDLSRTRKTTDSAPSIHENLMECTDASYELNGVKWHSLDHDKLFLTLAMSTK